MKQVLRFLLLLIALGNNTLYAQKRGQAAIDSLLAELPKAKEDTNKVNILYRVGAIYRNVELPQAVKYGETALALAGKLDWQPGIAKANALIGISLRRMGNYDKALDHFLRAAAIYTTTNDRPNLAGQYMNMANVYSDQGDKTRTLEYYFKALKIFEELGDKPMLARVSQNIGLSYSDNEKYSKALEYYFKSLKLNEETGDTSESGVILGNIGYAYACQEQHSTAVEYYLKAIKMDEEAGLSSDLASVLGRLGHSYVKLREYAKGIECLEKAVKIAEELGEENSIALNLEFLGAAYVSLATDTVMIKGGSAIPGNRDQWLRKAIAYCQRGVAICKEIEFPDGLQNCYNNISRAYRAMGDFKHAVLYADSFYVLRDSIYSNDNKVKMAELATKREEELKEKQIAINKLGVEKKRNERIFFGTGLALMLVIVSGLFFSRKTIQKEKNISEGLLLNILPAEVAEELKAKGSAEAKLMDDVTVLFTDFKGFTQISEKLSPHDLVAEIHTCFSAFDLIMKKHGIEKIKTIGDAYMAAGGLPTPNTTHATDVIKAAIEIQQYMQEHKAGKIAKGELYFEIRIGVHTGPVVAGIVGVKKFQYDIWGDTVNTASRMESSGEAGRINISETTYQLVKDKFACEYRGEVVAKNKGQMKMYFVS